MGHLAQMVGLEASGLTYRLLTHRYGIIVEWPHTHMHL